MTFTGGQALQQAYHIYLLTHLNSDGIDLYLASDLSLKMLNTKKVLLKMTQYFSILSGGVTSHPCHTPMNPRSTDQRSTDWHSVLVIAIIRIITIYNNSPKKK